LAANPNSATLGAYTYNPRFPGQVFDAEAGWFYNVNRDYNPALGRYIQSDPIGLAGGSLTTFGYVNGNPLGESDVDGLFPMSPSGFSCLGCHHAPFAGPAPIPAPKPTPTPTPTPTPNTPTPDIPDAAPTPAPAANAPGDAYYRPPPRRWWPSMPDDDAQFCRAERRACAELCKMLKANGAVALTNAFVAACRRNAAGIELTEELL
jgi:RHS repeat-associated protein